MRILLLALTIIFGITALAEAQTNQSIKLRVGQQKTIVNSKLKVRFISLIEDSRCPEGSNCVWAGNAKVKFSVSKSQGKSELFELNTGLEPKSFLFEGYEIKLLNVTPEPKTNTKVAQNGYAAILTISESVNPK